MANALNHVAFIMDGNGRWAQAKGLPRSEGHLAGMDALKPLIRKLVDLEIKYASFYAFSTENFSRPQTEVRFLMSLVRRYFQSEIQELLDEGARLRFLGDWSLFSFPIRQIFKKAQTMSQHKDTINLNFMLGYGSRQEILRAVNTLIAEGKKEITEEDLQAHLYTAGMPEPDLLIRTGSEQRLSNFMLYQLSYSELYFTDILWPDFKPENLVEAIEVYRGRERRYGQVL